MMPFASYCSSFMGSCGPEAIPYRLYKLKYFGQIFFFKLFCEQVQITFMN